MQVFAYEYFTGGGARHLSLDQIGASLLAEASAMIAAITADLSGLPHIRVVTTRDARLPPLHPSPCKIHEIASCEHDRQVFTRLAADSDWTLIIAPETDGILLDLAQRAEANSARLLSPNSPLIAIASDKQAAADTLHRRNTPAPLGWTIQPHASDPPFNLTFPAVIKPLDGCGSQGVRFLRNALEFGQLATSSVKLRIEPFVPGLPVSVSVLCGPAGNVPLPTCEQHLSTDGSFAYLGGRLPIAPELDDRARRLALQAISALPPTVGYLGLDLVLGDSSDGSGDSIIEINPRLTTSYVGLRALSQTNLAAALLAVVQGLAPNLSFAQTPLEFTAAGAITS